MLELLSQFQPLLKKYSSLLYKQEDAYEELQTEFISLIKHTDWSKFRNSNDGAYVNFISISVRRYYIALSKKQAANREVVISSCPEKEEFRINSMLAIKDQYETLLDHDLRSVLTPKESEVIYWTCIQGMPSAWVAAQLDESRQNINQTKQRAIKKLQVYFKDNHRER